MLTLIETIFGSKIGRIIGEVLLILALLAAAVLYLEHRGATRELAKLHESSTKLIATANANIAKETAQHNADNAANQEKLNATLSASHALGDALDRSVRNFNAYRSNHPDVPYPASGPGAASGGECGFVSCGNVAGVLAERGDDLARANGELAATLQACQRDRDSLKGK